MNDGTKLVKIGAGFCGTVWADDRNADNVQSIVALKRADGGPGRSISHEYRMHNHILTALNSSKFENHTKIDAASFRVNIPRSFAFLQPDSSKWPSLLARLPPNFTSCEAILNERIMPMPLSARELLAKRYWTGENTAAMAAEKTNESCLVRAYFGRRSKASTTERKRLNKLQFFSLRNFPLHIDQMEELALPVAAYATAMADALAFMHWVAKVDACDVEFVLARCRDDKSTNLQHGSGIGVPSFQSDAFGEHAMWVLDFDCCRDLEMSEEGMMRAAECFLRNDPYYPKPGGDTDEDVALWDIFQERFLEKSRENLESEREELRRLPGVLIQKITENRTTWMRGPRQ